MRDGELFKTYKEYRIALRKAKKEESQQLEIISLTSVREETLRLNQGLSEEFYRRQDKYSEKTNDDKTRNHRMLLLNRLKKLYKQGIKLKKSILSPVYSYQLNDMEVTA